MTFDTTNATWAGPAWKFLPSAQNHPDVRSAFLKPRRRQMATRDRGNHWAGSGKIHKGTKCPHGKNKRAHTPMHMLVLCQRPQKHTNVLEVHTPALRRVGQQNPHLSPNLPSCFLLSSPKNQHFTVTSSEAGNDKRQMQTSSFFFFFLPGKGRLTGLIDTEDNREMCCAPRV